MAKRSEALIDTVPEEGSRSVVALRYNLDLDVVLASLPAGS